MKSTLRRFVIVMAVVVCLAMLASVFMIANAAGHDCTHEDCAICYQVNVCMNMLKSFALVLVLLAIVLAVRAGAAYTVAEGLRSFALPTLITCKVKLSN